MPESRARESGAATFQEAGRQGTQRQLSQEKDGRPGPAAAQAPRGGLDGTWAQRLRQRRMEEAGAVTRLPGRPQQPGPADL